MGAWSAVLVEQGYTPGVSLVCALMAGAVAGFVTGFLNTVFKITDLLSGILTAYMLYSINIRVMGSVPNIALIDQPTLFTGYSPLYVLLALVGLIVGSVSYMLSTDFGLGFRSVGQNKRLSVNMGVNINRMALFGLALSNGLIALGGGLFSHHQGFADISQGFGTVIIGLAAVMIGEKLLPYRGLLMAVASCVVGSVLYRIFIVLALHTEGLGIDTQDLNLITGLMVIGVMLLPKARRW